MSIPQQARKKEEQLSFLSLMYQFDVIGFLLFSGFAVQLLLALEWGGNTYSWNSAKIIGLFCGAGVSLIPFVIWEHRMGGIAMIPFPLLRRTIIWSSCLVTFFFFGCVLLYSYYVPIYFQAVKGVSPSKSGVYLLPGIGLQVVFAMLSGVLSKSLGVTNPVKS
jgi:hypothetical protein